VSDIPPQSYTDPLQYGYEKRIKWLEAELVGVREDCDGLLTEYRAELARVRATAWNEHNACGICPYQKSIQDELTRVRAQVERLAEAAGPLCAVKPNRSWESAQEIAPLREALAELRESQAER
jgi:hypothetical protein